MLHVFFHAWKIHTLLVSGQSTLLVRTIEMAPSVVAAFFGAWKLSKTCRPVAVCRCIQLWDDVTIMCELKQKVRFCNFSLMKSVSNFWPVKSIGLGPSIWITYMCNIFKCIVYKHPHTMLQKTSWISHPPNFCLLSRNDWFLLHNHGFTWHLKHLRCYRCLRQWSKNNLIKKGTVQHIWIIMYHNIFANIEIYKRKIIINFTNIIDTYILTCTCVRYSIETTRLFFCKHMETLLHPLISRTQYVELGRRPNSHKSICRLKITHFDSCCSFMQLPYSATKHESRHFGIRLWYSRRVMCMKILGIQSITLRISCNVYFPFWCLKNSIHTKFLEVKSVYGESTHRLVDRWKLKATSHCPMSCHVLT